MSDCRNSPRIDVVLYQSKESARSDNMPEQITSSVEALEGEAEKILAEAKARASGILLQAKEEARKILSSQLPLDQVKTESDKTVSKARAEADKKIKDSEKKAAEIRSNADKKIKELTELVVNIVRGEKSA
jgi:vacuolar-type H+-ATPase subunit H